MTQPPDKAQPAKPCESCGRPVKNKFEHWDKLDAIWLCQMSMGNAQPAKTEEKPAICPKCGTDVEWVIPPIPGAKPFFQCQDGDCNWIQDDGIPSPSLELGSDNEKGPYHEVTGYNNGTGEEYEEIEGPGADKFGNHYSEIEPLNIAYHEGYQQALLKGGLDREKVLKAIDNLMVTAEPRKDDGALTYLGNLKAQVVSGALDVGK